MRYTLRMPALRSLSSAVPLRAAFLLSLGACCALSAASQAAVPAPGQAAPAAAPAVSLRYDEASAYRLVERSDWARYDDGKYVGHVYREVRGSLEPGAGGEYRGTFYVLEETLRDLRASARAVDDVYDAAFRVLPDGSYVPLKDNGFPTLRGFPAFPAEPVAVGDKWTARFVRAVDPRNTGHAALLPLIAQFEYRGEETYKGIPVRRIFAKYATRWRGGSAGKSAPPFSEASGTHDVDILVNALTGGTVLIRDRLDETFKYPDGATIRFKGFTIAFTEGSLGGARGEIIAKLRGGDAEDGGEPPAAPAGKPADAPAKEAAGPGAPDSPAPVEAGPEAAKPYAAPFELAEADGSGKPTGITVEETDAGIKLTVSDLRFAADSDALLPSEHGRLEILARALGDIPDRTFLVEGHTAAVGKPAGELALSERRAKRIVDELAARGIPPDRFIYKGWGGAKPVADNGSEEGRAKNRRVEITVLD